MKIYDRQELSNNYSDTRTPVEISTKHPQNDVGIQVLLIIKQN